MIEEENIKIILPVTPTKEPTKKLPVFYNPHMKLNRDISLLVINAYFKKPIDICLPLAGSGIRGIRFLKKLNNINKILFNDLNPNAYNTIKKNLITNNINFNNDNRIIIEKEDANLAMRKNKWDYIEIDPFGSPVRFIDTALQQIKNNGIISVTATDTATLCGKYKDTCLRKYFIKSKKVLWHDELGLRNLIAFCQREAARLDIYLEPLLAYTKRHYFKVFFKAQKSKQKSLDAIKKLSYIKVEKNQEIKISDKETNIGKTYIGKLTNKEFLEKLDPNILNEKKEAQKLIQKLKEELDTVGYYEIHKIIKNEKIKTCPKIEKIITLLKSKNYEASRVHNNKYGIKTIAPIETLRKTLKSFSNKT